MFTLFYSYDAMDGLYDCIWDVAILEFLVCILLKSNHILLAIHQDPLCKMYTQADQICLVEKVNHA